MIDEHRRTAIHEATQGLTNPPPPPARERSETRPAPGGGVPRGSVARGEATPYALNPETEVAYLFANGVRLARLAYEAPGDVPSIGGETLHVFFELGDHLGSTSVVLDKATGELVERSTYQAYGGSESDYRPERWKHFREDYRFTGKEEDVEVGLIYFGKRFLNPLLNRWVSADPLAVHTLQADPNLYAYVSGRALLSIDPLGLDETKKKSTSAAAEADEGLKTGNTEKAAKNLNGLSMEDMLIVLDRATPEEREHFKQLYGKVKSLGDGAKRIQYALEVVESRKRPEKAPENVHEDQVEAADEFLQRREPIDIARKEIGVKEKEGLEREPRIKEYHQATSGPRKDADAADDVEWCSSFVNWTHKEAGLPRTKSKMALSWKNAGEDAGGPEYGAVMIVTRRDGGHVGFVVGQTEKGEIVMLGGNQDEQVSLRVERRPVVGYRRTHQLSAPLLEKWLPVLPQPLPESEP